MRQLWWNPFFWVGAIIGLFARVFLVAISEGFDWAMGYRE